MKAGCRIAQDYYHGRFVAEGIIDYTKPRVDNSVRNELLSKQYRVWIRSSLLLLGRYVVKMRR